jgi:hypothetical protein
MRQVMSWSSLTKQPSELFSVVSLGIDLGRYRDRIEMLAVSVSIIRFDVHGSLLAKLEVLGDRAYMGEELCTRPGN